jgi:hypothetical protein
LATKSNFAPTLNLVDSYRLRGLPIHQSQSASCRRDSGRARPLRAMNGADDGIIQSYALALVYELRCVPAPSAPHQSKPVRGLNYYQRATFNKSAIRIPRSAIGRADDGIIQSCALALAYELRCFPSRSAPHQSKPVHGFESLSARSDGTVGAQASPVEVEPTTGFEPVTYGLRNRCSTS